MVLVVERRTGAGGAGGGGARRRSIPSPFAKGPCFEGISRTERDPFWSSFEAIYTRPHAGSGESMRARRVLHARRARIDLESNARSGRVAPRELALPGMRRTAHRSENVRRRESICRVWRLAQKVAQSSAPAEAAATWKRLAWLGQRVCRLVLKYMPDERFGRREFYGSSSRTATCARSRSLGATLTPASLKRGRSGAREAPVWALRLSNEGSVL